MARNVTDSEWQSLNVLSCSHCNLKTSDAAFFQAHPCKPKKRQITAGVSYSLVTAKFTCSLCTIELPETEFCEHLEGHMSLKPYVCKYCKRDFATRTDVCEHLRSFHEQCEQIFVLKLSGRTKEIVQKAKNNGKEFYKPLNVQPPQSSTSVAISKNLTQNLATVPGPSQKITKSPIASHPLLSSQDAASSSLGSTGPIVNQMVALRTHSHIASQPISNTALASPRPQLPGEQRRYFVIIPTQPQPGLVPTLSSSVVQTQASSCPSQSVSVPVSDVYWRYSLSQRLPGQARAPLVFGNVTSRLQGMGPHRISMQLPVTTLPNPATQSIQSAVPNVTQSINIRENHMVANELSSSVNQMNPSEQFIHTVAPGFCLNQVYLSSPSVQNETGIQITPPILCSLLQNAPASPAISADTRKAGNQLAPTFSQTPVKQQFLPAVVAGTEGIVRDDSSVSLDVPALSTDVSVNYHNPAEDACNIYKVSIQPFAKDIKPNIESEFNVESDNVSRDFALSVNLQTHQTASSSAAEVEHEQSSQAVIKSEDSTDDDTDCSMQIRIENIMSLSVFPDVFQPDVQNNATSTESHLTEAMTNGVENQTETGSNITEHQTETGSNATEHQTETGSNITEHQSKTGSNATEHQSKTGSNATEQQTKTVVSNTCPFLGLCKGYFVCLVCRLKWCSDSDLFFKHVWEKHTHEAGNSCCPTGYSPYCARLKAIVQAVYDRSQETMPHKFKIYFTPKSCTEIEDVQNISLLSENSNLIPSITENSNLIHSLTENSNLIPSLTEDSNLIPSITENSNLIPSITENSNLIPSLTENSYLIPSITEKSSLIPLLTENSNLIPSSTENSNLIPSVTENSNLIPSLTENSNLIPSLTENSTSTGVSLRIETVQQINISEAPSSSVSEGPDSAPSEQNFPTESVPCTKECSSSPPVALRPDQRRQVIENSPDFGAPTTDNELNKCTQDIHGSAIHVDLSHENLQNVMAIDLSSAAASTSDHPKSNSTTRTYEDISDDEFGGGINDCDQGTGSPNYSLLENLYSEDEMPLDLSKKTTQAEKSHGDATATSLSANETAAMSSVAHTDSLSPGMIETIHDSLTVLPSSANEVAATNSVPQIEGLLPESIRNACNEATFTPLSTTETAVGNSRKRTERLSTESTGMGDDDEFSLRCFYVCGICRLSWPKAVELEAHIIEDHALQQDLPCTYCQFLCSSSKHLIQHMEEHITINNRKTFSCSLLENSDKVAQFENNDMKFIIRMLKTSVAENDVSDVVFHFVCNTCQSDFEDLVRLGAHLQESLLKVIGCKHCESFFLNSFSWQKHMATEHVDLPRMYCLKQKLLCHERKLINNTPPQDVLGVSNTERDKETTAQENQCGSTHGYCQTTPETTSNILGKIEIGACTVIENSKADGGAIESTDTHSSHEERDATAMTDVIQVEAIPEHISAIPKLLDLVKSSRRIKSVLMSAVSLKTAKVSERGSFLDTASTSIDRRGDNIVVEQFVTATCTSAVTKRKGNTEVDVQGLVKPVSAHGSNELAEIVSGVAADRAAFDSITTAPLVNHCLNENSELNFVEQAGVCETSKSGVRNDTCTFSIENSFYRQMVSKVDNLNLDQVIPVESQGCGVVSGLNNRSRVSSDIGSISAAGLEMTETGIRLVLSEHNKLTYADNNCLPARNIGTDAINIGQESGHSVSAVLGKSFSSAVQYDIENGVSNVLEESEAQAVCIAVNENDICQTVVLSSQTSAEGGNKNKEMQTSALLLNNSQHSNEEARNKVSSIAEVNLSSSLENREKSVDHTAFQQTLQGAHMVDQACESGHYSEIGMNGLLTEPFINNRSLCTSTASSLLYGSGDVLNTVTNSLDPDHDSCHHDDICSIQDLECELEESASEIIGSDDTLGTDTHSIDKTNSNQKEDNQAVERSAREGEACGILYNKNSSINMKDKLSVRNETPASEEILEENVLNLPSDIGNFVEEKNSPFSEGQFSTTAEVSKRKDSSHTELLPDKVSVEEDFNNSVTWCKCGALISSLTDVNVAHTVQPQDKSWWMPISGMCDKCRLVAEKGSQPENTTKHTKSEIASLITLKGNKMLSEKAVENCVRALKRKAPLLISENTDKISRLENVSSDDDMRSKVDPSEISPIKQIVALDHCKLLSMYNKPYMSSEQAKVSPMLGSSLKTAALKCGMFLSERGFVAHEFVTSDKEMLDLPCKRKSEAEQGETKTLKQTEIRSEKHRKTEDSDHEIQSLDVTVPNSANFNCSVCTFFTSPSYTTLKQHIKTQHPHDTRAKVCRIHSRSLQNATGNEFQSADLTVPDTANFRCSACTIFTSPSYTTLKQHIKSQHPHDTRAKVCRIRSRSLQNAADQIEKLENPTLSSVEVGEGSVTMSHVNNYFTAHQQPGMDSKTNISCCETVVKNKSSFHAETKHKSVEVDSKSPYIVVTKLKTGIYVCMRKKCDFTCEWDLEKMKEHINSKHPYYSCGHCKAPYTKLEILQRHLKFVHRGLQPSIVGGTIEVDRLFKCVSSSHNGQRAEHKDVTSQTPAKRKKHRSSCSAKKCKAEARRELKSLDTKRHTSSRTHYVNMTSDQQNQPPVASTSKTKKTSKENVESRATTAQALQILQSKLAHSDSESILEHLSREVPPVTEYEASTLEKTAVVSINVCPLSAKTDGSLFEKTLRVKLPQIDLASGSQPSSSRVVSIVAKENQGEAEKSTAESNMSTFSNTFADIHRQPTTDPTDSLLTKKTVAQNAVSSFSPLPAKNSTSRPEYQKSSLQSSSLEASKYSKIKPLGPSLPSKYTVRKEGSGTISKNINKNVSLKPGTGVKSSVTIKKQELISNNISYVPKTDNTHENAQVPEICLEAALTYMSDSMQHHINAAASAVVTLVSFSKTQDKKPCGMPDQLETKTAAEGDQYKAFEAEGLSTLHSEANPSVQSGSKTDSMCENTATTSKMKLLNKNDYPLRCTVCSIILKCLRDTERHYIRKHPKKDIKLAERNSGFIYSSSGRCLQWEDVNNAPTDSYLCHYCAFRSSKRSGVEAHINSIHPEREVKVFSLHKPKSHKHCTHSKVADSPHRRLMPQLAKAKTGEVVAEINELKKKTTGASVCQRTKASRSNSPTPSQYSCYICKEIKYSEFQFRLHLASHSNFTYTTQLTTGTSFLCHTCGYVAKSNSDLAQHTGEHMSERQFKCFLCDHDSHHKHTLRNHIRLVHNKTVDGDVGIIDRCKQRSADLRPRLVNIDPRVHLIDPFRQHPNYLQKLVLKYDIKVLDLPGNIYTDILHHEHKEYDEYFDINKLM